MALSPTPHWVRAPWERGHRPRPTSLAPCLSLSLSGFRSLHPSGLPPTLACQSPSTGDRCLHMNGWRFPEAILRTKMHISHQKAASPHHRLQQAARGILPTGCEGSWALPGVPPALTWLDQANPGGPAGSQDRNVPKVTRGCMADRRQPGVWSHYPRLELPENRSPGM